MLFQSFDLQGNGRLREAEFFCGSPEIQVFRYRSKNLKPEILHAGIVTYIAEYCLANFICRPISCASTISVL